MARNKAIVFALALSAVSSAGFAADKSDKASTPSQNPNVTSGSAGGTSAASGDWSSFTDVDKDSSGFIEQSEATVVQGLDFISADVDSDQRISRSEYEAAKKGKGAGKGDGGGSPVGPTGGAGKSGGGSSDGSSGQGSGRSY